MLVDQTLIDVGHWCHGEVKCCDVESVIRQNEKVRKNHKTICLSFKEIQLFPK